jgi:hypothetical protein
LGHKATLLPNGKVLVAGGASGRSPYGYDLPVASAELYDTFRGNLFRYRQYGHDPRRSHGDAV